MWGAALQWHRELATVALTYGGQITPNLYANEMYFTHYLALDARITILPSAHIALYSGARVSANRIVAGPVAVAHPTIYAWGTEAGIGWFPDSLPQTTLAYQHGEQIEAHAGGLTFPGFYRNQVMLTVQARFPTFELGSIPTSGPARVDQADRPPDALTLAPPGHAEPTESTEPSAPEAPSPADDAPPTDYVSPTYTPPTYTPPATDSAPPRDSAPPTDSAPSSDSPPPSDSAPPSDPAPPIDSARPDDAVRTR
jgi:hypothetical protein